MKTPGNTLTKSADNYKILQPEDIKAIASIQIVDATGRSRRSFPRFHSKRLEETEARSPGYCRQPKRRTFAWGVRG